jgi:hypothetical protein
VLSWLFIWTKFAGTKSTEFSASTQQPPDFNFVQPDTTTSSRGDTLKDDQQKRNETYLGTLS